VGANDKIEFLTKVDVARHQIDVAIERFLDHEDYVSAITLAGAGEEILGAMLKAKGGTPAEHEFADTAVKVGEAIYSEKWEAKHFVNLMNDIRNGLKHFVDGADVPISRHAAAQMIDRAVTNFWNLRSEQTTQMQRFIDEMHGA
jgi:hypothetical protein